MPNNRTQPAAKESNSQLTSDSRNELVYQFDSSSIHVELVNDNPWFLAKDVCDALGIQNVTVALSNLEEYQKLTYVVHRSGQRRSANFVNESGLYSLIFQSRKPAAKAFQKWVTCDVLPEIRRTGSYNLSDALKKIPEFVIGGRRVYYYSDVCKKLECAGSGTEYTRKKQYPNHFFKGSEGRVYISVELAEQMRDNKKVFRNRELLATMPPITEKEIGHEQD